jgi:hypothetical protein
MELCKRIMQSIRDEHRRFSPCCLAGSINQGRPVGSFVEGGQYRKGWLRICVIDVEILIRRLDWARCMVPVNATRNFAIMAEIRCSMYWYGQLEGLTSGGTTMSNINGGCLCGGCPVFGFGRARGNLHLPLPRLSKAYRISLRGGRGGAEGSFFDPGQASNFHEYRG